MQGALRRRFHMRGTIPGVFVQRTGRFEVQVSKDARRSHYVERAKILSSVGFNP
jgi:hypothetical protein